MSLTRPMRDAVARSPQLLGDAIDLVAGFLTASINEDGGVANRAGRSDLYYSVFGLEAMRGLGLPRPINRIRTYLESHGDGARLDFVHLCCLARCWSSIAAEDGCDGLSAELRTALLHHLAAHRSADNGFAVTRHATGGSVYACFLALGAYEDLGADVNGGAGVSPAIEQPDAIAASLESLRTPDGGYANDGDMPLGTTPTTAAAATLLAALGHEVDATVVDWLMARRHEAGGFFAHPAAPVPDLLSTATALHALSLAGADLAPIRETCTDFLDALWSSRGSFQGSLADEQLDAEYCWYGLLAAGHLAER